MQLPQVFDIKILMLKWILYYMPVPRFRVHFVWGCMYCRIRLIKVDVHVCSTSHSCWKVKRFKKLRRQVGMHFKKFPQELAMSGGAGEEGLGDRVVYQVLHQYVSQAHGFESCLKYEVFLHVLPLSSLLASRLAIKIHCQVNKIGYAPRLKTLEQTSIVTASWQCCSDILKVFDFCCQRLKQFP